MAEDEAVRKLHEAGADDCVVALLDCAQPFQLLNKQEKLYAHFMAAAGFEGMKICLVQCSYESPIIFELLQRIFHQQDVASLAAAAALSELETKQLLSYAGSFYGNIGNYRSFGDSKIVPSLPVERFEAVVLKSKAFTAQPAVIQQLWDAAKGPMYALGPRVRSLGLGEDGVSTYYSANCTKADAEIAQKLLDDKKISPYNTRLFKIQEEGKTVYEIRIASVEKRAGIEQANPDASGAWSKIRLVYGDYSPLMARVVDNLTKAQQYAANDIQKQMLQQYIECFTTGEMEKHIQGSRLWVQDKGPAVETYIGFIESYRDPFGVKGEWEGFAAVVNKEISAKFGNLVSQAEGFLTKLPWPPAFEKDKFLRPDFTSLEVLGFGSGGIPAGINIPNYDSIRQSEGFKNVSLANVLRAGMSFSAEEAVTFLSDPDQALYKSSVGEAFDVQVGLHELLGHGSGKLFIEDESKKLNFDDKTTVNPVDGKPVASWYKPGETWDSKFSSIASSYEECRAEAIGIYLSVYSDILSIFGFQGDRASDITYINWLNMARAGVLALQFFTPGKGLAGWGQAHMQARYALLQVMLEAGEGFVQIKRGSNNDSYVTLDRNKIISVGHKAVSEFLRKLQVYKSTADYDAGLALYTKYTTVSDDMLTLRAEVIARRKPRRVFVQAVTKVDAAGDVQYSAFDATPEGLVKSFIARYPCCDDDLLGLWRQDAAACNPF